MRSKVAGIILILCFALSLIGCGREKGTITDLDTPESGKAGSTQLRTIDDVKDKRIAVLLGSVHDTYVLEHFPEAEAKQYKSNSDIVLAVKSGKVDVGLLTYEAVRELMRDDHELAQLGDNLFTLPVGMGFNKGNEELREQFNQFLKEIKADGTHADMVQRWIEEGNHDMPVIDNPGKNGVLVVGVVSDKGLPFCVKQNNQWIGLDIEFVKRFGAYLGKKVEFLDMEFGSLIAAAAANKVDMIASTLVITEERQKQVDFSDPYYELGTVFFALKKNIAVDDTKMATPDDIDGKRLGVMTGTIHDKMIAEKYPSTKILRFDTTSDMVVAIKSKKIDAAMMATSSAKVVVDSNPDLGFLVDDYMPKPLGMGFNKNNPELRDRFNAFLQKIREDGTYDEIYRRWFVEDPEKAVIPPVESSSTGETLVVGVAVDDLPYVAYINGQYTGCDIEIVQRFAAHEGMRLEIVPMQFGSLIAALASGKVDMITDGIAITEERAQKIDFSDPYMELKNAVIGLKSNIAHYSDEERQLEEQSFIKRLSDSFYSNLIVENRYQLIVDGLKVTALISILSVIFGTLLGALVCYMRMAKNKILQDIARVYINILRGTPVLVLLMIVFYVVFASVNIDPIIAAVIAFGMNFGAYVSEMFRTAIESVDKGQREAGIASGFTELQTFLYIIMPQAIRQVLPVYKGEFIALVKMTSVVGYIAVQDLTKAGDIIRSRTFDAFFPLIMVAVLYFLISWLLALVLDYLAIKLDPKRSRPVGGVSND